MSNLALILFDFDGMTAVVPRKSLQQCSPEELVQSSRAYVKVGKENLQVEVLELSDSKPDLNRFEKVWENGTRAKAIHEEQIKRLGTALTGGYLNIWSDDEVERLEVENTEDLTDLKDQVEIRRKEQKEVQTQVQKPVQRPIQGPKNKTSDTAQNAKKIKTKETPRFSRTKTVRATPKSCRKSFSSLVKTKTAKTPKVGGVVQQTNSKIKKVQKQVQKPVQRPIQGPKNKTSDTAQKQVQKPVQRPIQGPKNKTSDTAQHAKKIKTGLKNRSITILQEGSAEPSSTTVTPDRQPGFTDHLNEDQKEMLSSRLREHSVGKRSNGVQTDKTLVFTNVEELKRASCTNKKESGCQTMNTCVHYEDLNVKFDGMMTMIRELSKKVDDLINPQMSSFLINSTPIRMSNQPSQEVACLQPTPVTPAHQPSQEVARLQPTPATPVYQPSQEVTHLQSTPATPAHQPSQEVARLQSTPATPAHQPSQEVECLQPTPATPAHQPSQEVKCLQPTPATPAHQPSQDVARLQPTPATPANQSSQEVEGLQPSPATPAHQPSQEVECLQPTPATPFHQPSQEVAHLQPTPWTPAHQSSQEVAHLQPTPATPVYQSSQEVARLQPTSATPSHQPSHEVACLQPTPATPVYQPSQEVARLQPTPATPAHQSSQEVVRLQPTPATPAHQSSQEVARLQPTQATPAHQPSQDVARLQPTPATPANQPSQEVARLQPTTAIYSNQSCQEMAHLQPTPAISTHQTVQAVPSVQLPLAPTSDDLHYILNNSCNTEFTAEPILPQRQPLRTIDAQHIYSENQVSNLWEIQEKNDWLHTRLDTKLRVGRDFIWKYCASVKSVGNFGWALAQNLYSVEEMTGRNYNGNGQKGALSPRRRHAIEEAVIEHYGEGHMKQVRTAINTGIRGINYKIRNPISSEPSSKRRLLLGSGQLPTLLPATYKLVQSATGAMVAIK